ncbi:MAG: hypothetical protein R3D57_16875 [Hyphomicrobiaceae bacterium]
MAKANPRPPVESGLPPIPVHDVGSELGLSTLAHAHAHAAALLDEAAGHTPELLLTLADRISRQWLARSANPYLDEIDAVARRLGRAGGYFFNVHYEWGCTTGVKPASGGRSARLVRVLDWRTPGLGRHIMAARLVGDAGPWTTMTWPGFAGVLQAMAPGRFSAALNQAPMHMPTGLMPADWAVNRTRIWRNGHLPPAHLLRRVFEQATSYNAALEMLVSTPVSAPAIFTLAGLDAGQGVIVERRETEARVHAGGNCAANTWQAPDWSGRPRGKANAERLAMLRGIRGEVGRDLSWLDAPVLNETTRLVMLADAREGWIVAQGYEREGPATEELRLG